MHNGATPPIIDDDLISSMAHQPACTPPLATPHNGRKQKHSTQMRTVQPVPTPSAGERTGALPPPAEEEEPSADEKALLRVGETSHVFSHVRQTYVVHRRRARFPPGFDPAANPAGTSPGGGAEGAGEANSSLTKSGASPWSAR